MQKSVWIATVAMFALFFAGAPAFAQELDPAAGEGGSTSLQVNSLGIFQYGLAPKVEFGGQTVSGLLHVRLFNTGALSYLLLPGGEAYDRFDWGIGVGGGVRVYPTTQARRGFYIGGGAEYDYTKTIDDEDDMAAYITHSLTPYLEGGYRWMFGRFLLGAGALVGASVPVAWHDEPVGANGCHYGRDVSCPEQRSTLPFLLANVEVGWSL